MRSTVPSARGFTLVEVLVALLIMAIMAAMAWRGLDAIVRTRDISQARLERTMRLQTVMAQWEQDLSAVQDAGIIPPLNFDGATLRLTRRRPSGMQVVAWSKQGNALMRWESAVTGSISELMSSYQYSMHLQSDTPGLVRVIDGVSGWQLYFYRGNGWSNAMSSDDLTLSPPSAAASGSAARVRSILPTGVKMALQLEAESGWTGTLNRTVALGPQP